MESAAARSDKEIKQLADWRTDPSHTQMASQMA